jgi:hypothetical protein
MDLPQCLKTLAKAEKRTATGQEKAARWRWNDLRFKRTNLT